MVKVAEVLPASTVTLEGTVAKVLLLASETVMPLAGAAEAKVTVPVEGLPPPTVAGLRESPVIEAGVMVRFAVCVTPL